MDEVNKRSRTTQIAMKIHKSIRLIRESDHKRHREMSKKQKMKNKRQQKKVVSLIAVTAIKFRKPFLCAAATAIEAAVSWCLLGQRLDGKPCHRVE